MFQIIRKKELLSTNSYALELLENKSLKQPFVVVAEEQTRGRGQQKNQWFSEKGKSLTFSVVLYPQNITAERQFLLSQILCLALYDTLAAYTDAVHIKWPNDILINGTKCCGILIENAIMGHLLAHSVCGIGLNVNNLVFSGDYRATSLGLETKKAYCLEQMLEQILENIRKYYTLAEQLEFSSLNTLYHSYLYGIGMIREFEDKDGFFKATVIGIDQYGQLLLEDTKGQLRTYGFKEVAWLP